MMLERRSILSILFMAAFTSRITSSSEWVMAGAVVILACSEGMSATDAFSTRTLSVLPVDTRDISRATWVLIVVLPVLLLTAGRLLSASIFAPFEDPWSWVFPATPVRVFYECLFFALAGAWNVLVPDRDGPDDRENSGLYLVVLAVLGIMVVPFVVLLYLPATFSGISALGWLLTGVAITLAATPLFLSPKPYVRPEPTRLTSGVEAASPVIAAAGPARAPRLSGLWALMPRVMTHAAAWTAVFITFHLFLDWTMSSQVFLQPFDPAIPTARFLERICFFLLFAIGLLPGLGDRLPMLKLLPIPSTRAAAVLTLAPLLTPVVYWSALVLMHVAVSTAWPETLRFDVLLCLMGLAGVVDALGIKSGSQRGKLAIGASILLGLIYALDGDRTMLEPVLQYGLVPQTGVAAMGVAYLLNLHTMTRSERGSRAYRYGRSGMPQGAR
jgi:hypothetical protein